MSVKLRKMTADEFKIFCRWSMEYHAKELVEELHISDAEALKRAAQEFAQMLPDGLQTEHNYLLTIAETDSEEAAGFIWTIHEETAGCKQSFLCDFAIWETKRCKGYGETALRLAENRASEAGCVESVLFVADRNMAAKALYEKCGYQFLRRQDYGCYMIKKL